MNREEEKGRKTNGFFFSLQNNTNGLFSFSPPCYTKKNKNKFCPQLAVFLLRFPPFYFSAANFTFPAPQVTTPTPHAEKWGCGGKKERVSKLGMRYCGDAGNATKARPKARSPPPGPAGIPFRHAPAPCPRKMRANTHTQTRTQRERHTQTDRQDGRTRNALRVIRPQATQHSGFNSSRNKDVSQKRAPGMHNNYRDCPRRQNSRRAARFGRSGPRWRARGSSR